MPPARRLLVAAAVLHLLLLPVHLALAAAQGFRGFSYLLDCGAAFPTTDSRGLRWDPDGDYVSGGTPGAVSLPGLIDPTLATLRTFPLRHGAKFCYELPVDRNRRYLVRPTFFYGALFASSSSAPPPPPVFDLIVDGTFWTAVNTTDDALAGAASSYEGVFPASGRNMSFCLGVNPDYTDAGPFISALQVIQLDDSVYNATDFPSSAMGLIARTRFGSTGGIERYPNDSFDRYWQPFPDNKHAVSSTQNVTSADFWNLPPPDVFNTAFVAEQDAPLVLQWPPVALQNDSYYVALYFADTLPDNSRTFDVYINDYLFQRSKCHVSWSLRLCNTMDSLRLDHNYIETCFSFCSSSNYQCWRGLWAFSCRKIDICTGCTCPGEYKEKSSKYT